MFFCYIFALCSFRFFAIFLYENIVIKINACALFVVSLPIEIGNGFGLFSINSLFFSFLPRYIKDVALAVGYSSLNWLPCVLNSDVVSVPFHLILGGVFHTSMLSSKQKKNYNKKWNRPCHLSREDKFGAFETSIK